MDNKGKISAKGKEGKKTFSLFRSRQMSGLVLLTVIIMIIFTVGTQGLFLNIQNIKNILVAAALNGIIGMGMTLVLITGGIDLSVCGNVIMTSMLTVSMMLAGVPWVICLLAALVIGGFVGLINGISIGKFGMVAFVVTMAMDNITQGFGKWYTNGLTLFNIPEIHGIFSEYLFGVIPGPIIMMAVVAAFTFFLLKYTRYGRKLYAVGGNPRAAWMSGINDAKIITITYVISGLYCGLGAILMTSRLMSASPTMVSDTEMDAIAAAVLGGTSLMGGVGSVSGTIIGAITIAMISNGLNLFGVSTYVQQMTKGIIIFAVVALDVLAKKRGRE